MIADIILGNNIDTLMWINELQEARADFIIVLDYEFNGEPFFNNGVLYISTYDIRNHLTQFDSTNYYKSLYIYPGMGGKMSTFSRKE